MSDILAKVHSIGLFDSSVEFAGIIETKPRSAKCYELSVYLADGGVAHINSEHHNIKKGDIILASPGDVRHSTLHYISKYVFFDTENEQLRGLISSMPKHMHTEHSETISDRFDEQRRVYQSIGDYRDLELGAGLIALLFEMRNECLNISDGGFACISPEINQSVEYIRAHFSEQIDIEKIADSCNMSTSNFHKRFVNEVNTTPNEYLLELRIKSAKSLLVTSGWSISKIAEKCGFNSQAYFCCCFKKREGISPGNFRKFYKNI